MSNIKKNKFALILSICVIYIIAFTFNYLLASTFEYPLSKNTTTKTDQSSISTVATTAPEFAFKSVSQVLMEPYTGKIIYANNENEKLFPASVTKIMSLILIMEQIDSGKLKYTDKITCSKNASGLGGSQIWFKEGEQLSVDEALKCICVASANDVTLAMAELIAGTEQNFVKMMNNKAAELGMVNTVFENCHGIDDDITIEQHHTTAKDIALMSRELLVKHPDVTKYTSIWMDSIRGGTFGLTNTNKLVRFYEGTIGLKTGSTSKAMFNVSVAAKKNDTTFISVIMKAPTGDIRSEEAQQLLNYAFATYEVQKVEEIGKVIDSIKINKHITSNIQVKNKESLSMLVDKGQKIEYEKVITYNPNIVAPIQANTVVGKIILKDKTTKIEISSSDLVVDTGVNKSSLKEYFIAFASKYIMKI
jgi:D-alanyl-D-alanine carboxypeptidase (penicillin-binding protein 5/6)